MSIAAGINYRSKSTDQNRFFDSTLESLWFERNYLPQIIAREQSCPHTLHKYSGYQHSTITTEKPLVLMS